MGRHFKSSILFFAGALLATSCGDPENNDNTPNLRTLSAAEQQVAAAGNEFALDIFSRLSAADPDANIFISPFSISTALSMTANGAKGETLDEMKQALATGHLSNEEMNQAYRDLAVFLLGLDKTVKLQIANSNWYNELYNIHPQFEQLLLDYYSAEVMAADFGDAATKDRINGWIEQKTEGKIKDMLDGIPAGAVMYLVNAIYFKADWQYQFDKAKTADVPFYTPGGEVSTKMMYTSGAKVRYNATPELTFLDLPYGNGQFSMTILMETGTGKDINSIIAEMEPAEFAQLVSEADSTTAAVYLPRFRLGYKETLNRTLVDMGMERAFGGGDFSGLFEENLPLEISRVLHQAVIEVNEEGSEAAAATVVEMRYTSISDPTTFRIDRPFAFFIREKHSNTILFAGKMLNPAAE